MADGYINDGTATATAGSKTVTFAGVSVSLFRAGWPFNQGGASGTIASLDSDANTATLVDNWGGDTSSAAAYTVLTIPSSRVLAETTTRWLEYLNGPILSIAQMMDDAAPSDGETLVWDTAGWVATDIFASPTITGILTANKITASSIVMGETTDGGWSGAAILEVKAGDGKYGISGYSNGTTGGPFAFAGRVDNVTAGYVQFLFGATTIVGTITTNGTSTAYNTSSDRRLKQNIQDALDPWTIIRSLRVRSWDWISNDNHEPFGFVAQEEFEVYPNAVMAGDDGDLVERQWGRDDSKLVPLLVKAVQMLDSRVSALESA